MREAKHPPSADGTFFSKEGGVKFCHFLTLFRKEGGSAEPGVLLSGTSKSKSRRKFMRLLSTSRSTGPGRQGAYIAQVSYSGSGGFGAMRDSERRDIPLFAPRGMRYRPAEGDNLLMIAGENRDVCAGVLSQTTGLLPGELEICGPNGSRIKFTQSGDIVINGLTVTRKGEIIREEGT